MNHYQFPLMELELIDTFQLIIYKEELDIISQQFILVKFNLIYGWR